MVRCRDCGFLTATNYRSGELREWYVRQRRPDSSSYVEDDGFSRTPVCFVSALPIGDEIAAEFEWYYPILLAEVGTDHRETAWEKATDNAVWNVQDTERECAMFIPYQKGVSPKEHREMLDREWMREQEDKRLAEDRRWRAEMRREERVWRVIELLVLGGMVSVATLLAGAVGRGWAPSWWPL